MNSKEIDILNIVLIIISLFLAFEVPFGLLIVSYVFLGPLHYLTEINWLNEKNYFVKEKNWMGLFAVIVFIMSIPVVLKLGIFQSITSIPEVLAMRKLIYSYTDEMIMILFLFTIGLIFLKDKLKLFLFLVASTILSTFLLHYFDSYALAITIFFPTLIHVYLFTLLFMIYGTLRSKTTPGVIGIVLLLIVPLIIATSKINPNDYFIMNDYTRQSMEASGFTNLTMQFAKLFTPIVGNEFQFFSILGIKLQIFIAFAYVYHYLNWFSKTSIIRWDKSLSKSKVYKILIIWGLSVGLYLYNLRVGFIVLTFISMLHVFLEFPLNITSIKEIGLRIKSQVRPNV